MTKDEALKLALEFLERPAWRHEYALANINQASTAIKEALANVATNDTSKERVDEIQKQRHKQEPVGWFGYDQGTSIWFETNKGEDNSVPLYTTPPQRTWVGLTDEEIGTIAYSVNPLDGIRQFSRAIEAKLKEKNT